MAENQSNDRLSPKGIEQLVSVAAWIGAAATFRNGAQYVDRAMFWEWMAQSYHGVAARPGGWAEFVRTRPRAAGILFTGKVQEWDWARDFRQQFVNIGSTAKPVAESTARHDVVVRDLLRGTTEHVESKFAASRASAQASVENALRKPNIHRIVGTPELVEVARERGLDERYSLEIYRTAEEGTVAAEQRMTQAPSSAGGLTVRGVVGEVGKGAVIGAVVSITASTIGHFAAYQRGELTDEQLCAAVLKDGSKGALKGAIFGGVNVGVQAAAVVLGVGAPLVLPVMVAFGVALDQIVDPAFGDGAYRDVLESLGYTAETARLHTEYADACARSYDHLAALLPHVAVIEHAYQQEAERGARIKTELRAALDDLPIQRPGEP